MSMIQFDNGCRNCHQSSGIKAVIMEDNDLDYYQNLTDYQVSKVITETLTNNNIICEFCESNNWDLANIEISGFFPFNLEKLKRDFGKKGKYLYIFNLNKENNYERLINTEIPSQNTDVETDNFKSRCKTEIQSLINLIPSSECIHHPNGIIYACFTGTGSEIRLEKFRHTGYSKESLILYTNMITE